MNDNDENKQLEMSPEALLAMANQKITPAEDFGSVGKTEEKCR